MKVNPIEALVIMSIDSEKQLDDLIIDRLRDIIKTDSESDIGFDISSLKYVEGILPTFGTVDETIYSGLRIKLSNEIGKYEREECSDSIVDELGKIVEDKNATKDYHTNKKENYNHQSRQS